MLALFFGEKADNILFLSTEEVNVTYFALLHCGSNCVVTLCDWCVVTMIDCCADLCSDYNCVVTMYDSCAVAATMLCWLL